MVWVSQGTTYGKSPGKQLTRLPTKDRLNLRMEAIRVFETSANIYGPNRRIHPRILQFSSTSLTRKAQPLHVMNSQNINSQDINSYYTVMNSHDVFICPHSNYIVIYTNYTVINSHYIGMKSSYIVINSHYIHLIHYMVMNSHYVVTYSHSIQPTT